MTIRMLNKENAYCILNFTLNADLRKSFSGRHLDAALASAIRTEPELSQQGQE